MQQFCVRSLPPSGWTGSLQCNLKWEEPPHAGCWQLLAEYEHTQRGISPRRVRRERGENLAKRLDSGIEKSSNMYRSNYTWDVLKPVYHAEWIYWLWGLMCFIFDNNLSLCMRRFLDHTAAVSWCNGFKLTLWAAAFLCLYCNRRRCFAICSLPIIIDESPEGSVKGRQVDLIILRFSIRSEWV